MTERADKQQKSKTETPKNQPAENTTQLESLKITTDQAASASPPETPDPPPIEPNSLHGLHSYLGNQRVQRLLATPTLPLHSNTIHDLQSRIGNQGVQRLLTKNKSSYLSTTVIARETLKSSLIQRRVPELEDIDDEALETSSDEDNEINRRGLQEVLRRAIHDMGEPRSTFFLSMNYNGNYVQDTISSGTTEQLMGLVRLIEGDSMTGADGDSLVLEDTTATAVSVRDSSNYPQIRQAVERMSDLLVEIGSSATYDQHLRDVFGDDAQYGWQQAKARFPRAGQELRRTLARNHIRSDDTDSTEEMDAGALTSPGERILVTAGCVTNPDSPEAFRIYTHEAFHYAYADILDGGGYGGSNQDFRTCSASVKFYNADHYGEVCRRTQGAGEPGVEYRPAAVPATGDHDQVLAVDLVRQAWTSAMAIFGMFRDQYNRQQRGRRVSVDMVNTLLHHSILFELTYHQRHTGRNTPINQIDLALAEGVARRLSEAMTAINAVTHYDAHSALDLSNGWSMRNAYIEVGMRNIDSITSSYNRDVRMVQYLAPLANIFDIPDMPPDYLL